jgi:hypothetical protein
MSTRAVTNRESAGALAAKPESALQRKCACGQHTFAGMECEGCGKQQRLQRRATGQDAPARAPSIVHEVLRSPGQPLDVATRSFMEPRFRHDFSRVRMHRSADASGSLAIVPPGDQSEREADNAARRVVYSTSAAREGTSGYDFSRVRVHTSSKAAASAHALNARAYTVGKDIVFADGQYRTATSTGRELIAHELAHVVQQQATGQHAVARQHSDQRYQTRASLIERAQIEQFVGVSYWKQIINNAYELDIYSSIPEDPEERDAMFSVLWQKRPTGEVKTKQVIQVKIPARADLKDSKPLIYEFIFSPKDQDLLGAKDKLRINFIGAGDGATPVVVSKAPAAYSPRVPYNPSKFPSKDYWKQNPEEEKYLFYWIENAAPATFNQLVTTRVTKKRKNITTTAETTYRVEGEKTKNGKVSHVSIEFVGTLLPLTQQVPADYRAKDYGDVLLEESQTTPDAINQDRLGKVNLPEGISADELLAVKYYIRAYFKSGKDGKGNPISGTRNAEVDAIVLVPNKDTKVYYTFNFLPNNDVNVKRIGEEGKDAQAGQVDPSKLDVARAPEYAEKAKDAATFSAWLKIRYPKETVTGQSVEELRANINKQAEAKADKPEWYANYDIKILDKDEGKKRLKEVHKYEEARVSEMKTFLPSQLRLVESVFQTMTKKILKLFNFLGIARQRVAIEKKPDKTFAEDPALGGVTITSNTNQKTVIIFDKAFTSQDVSFLGGEEGVIAKPAMTYAHELGHIVGTEAMKKKFEAFVTANGIKPFTWYAETGGTKEFFPEAFSLFHNDPQWMKTNYPELYQWFKTMTGKASSQ